MAVDLDGVLSKKTGLLTVVAYGIGECSFRALESVVVGKNVKAAAFGLRVGAPVRSAIEWRTIER